jgi:hypothetical protein
MPRFFYERFCGNESSDQSADILPQWNVQRIHREPDSARSLHTRVAVAQDSLHISKIQVDAPDSTFSGSTLGNSFDAGG